MLRVTCADSCLMLRKGRSRHFGKGGGGGGGGPNLSRGQKCFT